jgi:hypothetical protein
MEESKHFITCFLVSGPELRAALWTSTTAWVKSRTVRSRPVIGDTGLSNGPTMLITKPDFQDTTHGQKKKHPLNVGRFKIYLPKSIFEV